MGGVSGAFAGETPSVADDVAMVQPFIGETTAVVLKVDPTRLSMPDLPDRLKSAMPGSEEAYKRLILRETAERIKTFRAATGGQAVYATVGIPLSKAEWPAFLFLKETPDVKRKLLFDRSGPIQKMESCIRDGVIVGMPGRRVNVAAAVDAIVPSPREALADAFEAVGGYPIQVLLLPPDYVRRTVTELMPQLPRRLGGGSSDVLTEGLVWAALGVDPGQLRTELIVQSRSQQAAQDLVKHFPKMLRSVYSGLPELKTRVPRETFEALLPLVAPQVNRDRFVLRLDGAESTSGSMRLVATVAFSLHERTRSGKNIDNFKHILLAMHNYHSVYEMFPPQDKVRDKSGKSKLSWRVCILPFLEQGKLYKEFHLDEPWDSAHNKKLIAKMPKIYKGSLPGIMPGHTTFLSPVGKDTVFGGEKATRIRNVSDGTSQTVVLVEVKPGLAVPWTAPEDYAFDPNAPGRGLQISARGRFLAALADGSVRQFPGNLEPELLLRLFQKSDGHPIDWKAIR